MKEYRVHRATVLGQGFTVMAKNAAEARAIIEDLSTSYATDPEDDSLDPRITWVGQPDVDKGPTFFVRTKDWVER